MEHQYRILIADDDSEIRSVLKNFLELKGHIVETASNGREALARADATACDILLTDIRMPVMDGIALTREMSRLYPDVSIMVMTGYSDEYSEEDALGAGARDFVTKPFALHDFSIRFQKMLRDHGEMLALRALAYLDVLTGLPNRKLFHDRLKQALEYAQRYHHLFALLYLDLDNFKEVNDTHGHETGDRLLTDAGMRLRHCTRRSDTVARLGGDEFGIVLAHLTDDKEAEQVSHRIIEALSRPFDVDGRTCSIGVSIGISIFPASGEDAEDLLRNADAAMYEVKATGKNGYRFSRKSG
ncbi:MAG: GGDEF domain-containing response regulator [Nitrospiraceae bacterium]|nr:GGDEF domain-containing response regulator [Nitrospiraceae bacterium]